MVDQNSFIRERPFFEKKYFANLSRTPCLSFVESMLSNNSSYEIHPPPAKSHRIIADNFFIACQHPASIAEYPSQDRLLLIRQFFARLTGPTLSQNFRGTFAKVPQSADPSHQQGAHQRKSKHQGPWCLALAKSHFWKLGCCIWSLFLGTSESNFRQYQVAGARMRFKTMVFGCGEAVSKPHLRKLGCYLWCGTILLPDPGRQEVVALNKL